MRLTISGTPGSGKTVVSKNLSRKLRLKYYGLGKLMRDFARRKGLNLMELTELLEKYGKLDRRFNDSIKKLNKEDNFVLDSRLGFLFIKKGVHIYLDANINTRAERIFRAKRKLESYRTIKDVKEEIKKRFLSEKNRFKNLYGIDFTNPKHYNLIIDTTNLNTSKISKIILKYLKK